MKALSTGTHIVWQGGCYKTWRLRRSIGITEVAKREGITVDVVREAIECRRLELIGQNRVTADSYEVFLRGGGLHGPRNICPRQGVYFVKAGEFIKIGQSIDVVRRWPAGIITDLPFEHEPLGFIHVWPPYSRRVTEERAHVRFAHLRVRGEWFKDAPEIRAYIRDRALPWPA